MDKAQRAAIEAQDALLRPPTFYELLGLPEDVTEAQVDAAFADFLRSPEQDPKMMAKRKHAWEVLREPLNRSFYDEHLAKLRSQNRLGQPSYSDVGQGVGSMSMFTMSAANAEEPERSGRRR
jgi:curved DNA-binding protein CbpA